MPTRLDQIMVKMGFDTSESSKVTDAMNKVNHETGKASEGFKLFSFHGREGHKVLHEIGHEAPIVGGLLRAALSPEAIGIMALGAAFTWIAGQFEKVGEKVKELSNEMNEMWQREQDASIKAAEAADEFHRKVSDAVDESKHKVEDENKAFERQLKLLDEIYAGHQKTTSAIDEAADADTARKRKKEDRTFERNEEKALAGAGNNSVAKEAIKKKFELEKQALADKREYEDAVTKNQREKQAAEDARFNEANKRQALATAEEVMQKQLDTSRKEAEAIEAEMRKKGALKDLDIEQKRKLVKDIEKEVTDVTADQNRRSGAGKGGFSHSIAEEIAQAAGVINPLLAPAAGSLLKQDAEAQEENKAKLLTLEKNRKAVLDQIAALEKADKSNKDESAEKLKEIQGRESAIKDLKAQQATLDQQISQHESQRKAIEAVRDQELQRMKNDLLPHAAQSQKPSWVTGKGPLSGASQTAEEKSAALDKAMLNDVQLQQALQGQKTESDRGNKSGAKYWQDVIDARTKMDRSLFPGVPTTDELKNKSAAKEQKGFEEEQLSTLKDIFSVLNGDK